MVSATQMSQVWTSVLQPPAQNCLHCIAGLLKPTCVTTTRPAFPPLVWPLNCIALSLFFSSLLLSFVEFQQAFSSV
jgi:hypothetical protein